MDSIQPIIELPEGIRILVIEDRLDVVDMVKTQVGNRGCVVLALDPKDIPMDGHFDLILLDWFWGPYIGGDYKALLKERFPEAIIIGHSSSPQRKQLFGETPACGKGDWFKLYIQERAKRS